ncbi:conserved membrane hypothetical protein [Candidatus Roizmanbacteria bacterium]|nr:conserved membrane hypothetical protein [Candidatus Roizmanbacteria bacterium]
MSKLTLAKLVLYLLIPIQLLIFTFLVPPFQKPDEQTHFEQSLIISKGFLSCQKKSNNMVPLEKKYIDFIKTPYLDLLTHGGSKLPVQIFLKDLLSNKQDNKKINFNIDHLCSFPIISYLPQAFSLIISSMLKLNPIMSLYFGRLFMGILGYFWFLYLYKRIAKNFKLILLFTFALPMTLHQISSFSYDTVHIMLALTFFTLIINENIGVINHTTTKYIRLFFVLFLFLLSKKVGYEVFFLFIFLIPFKIKPIIISSLIFAPFYLLSKLTGSYDLQYFSNNQIFNPIRQINFLFSNPINIIKVIAVTTVERFSFYLQSLIGIFGWLEYGLDPLSYLLYGLFLVYVIVETRLASSLHKNKTILLFIALIISYVFIILLGYVFYTVTGILVADGIQGRYFIPFVPFIILLIIQYTQNIKFLWNIKIGENIKTVIYLLAIIYLISGTFYSVFNRYYLTLNYFMNFINFKNLINY